MLYKDFTKINLEDLKTHKEITIIKFSDFGFPICIKLKLEDIFLKNYAQYNNCLYIQGNLHRKRKSSVYLIKPYENFIIYNGFVDMVDYTKKTIEGSVTITELGMCFDENNLLKSICSSAEILVQSYNLN
jgi:hypothetical protein